MNNINSYSWQVYYAGRLLATTTKELCSAVVAENISNGTIKMPCPVGAIRVVPVANSASNYAPQTHSRMAPG